MLPSQPRTAAVVGPDDGWRAALASREICLVDTTPELVVATSGEAALAGLDADLLLLVNGARGRPPRRGGYTVVRYAMRTTRGGVVHLLPRPRLAPGIRGIKGDALTVACRGSVVPAAVVAAVPKGVVLRVTFGVDPRRRAVFVVAPGAWRHAAFVVKTTRAAGEGERAAAEQHHLRTLGELGLDHVPAPLGHGKISDMAWSAETFVPGVAMAGASWWWQRRHGARSLDQVSAWLGQLAVASAHERPVGSLADAHLPLRDEARARLGPLLRDVGDVPSVMVHGDLASGENTFVHGAEYNLIDWETAIEDGLPLVDLLPTVALGMARVRGCRDAASQAAYVISLCEGGAIESPWLFERVRDNLRRLAVPIERAGPLAALAWGYQASMRARHDELVRASGEEPLVWTSAAEIVLARWLAHDRLGLTWSALTEAAKVGP